MKLGIMQPYFMPYLGYWQLMAAVDKYVVYDDVQYIKGGWINRNNILLNGQKHLFTIIQSGASANKQIREVTIADDFVKFRRMLDCAYTKAPYYKQVMEVMETIFTYPERSIGKFMLHSFEQVAQYLGFQTEFILSSNIEKTEGLHAQDRVIDICKRLGATDYYNAIGGQELYSKEIFAEQGINLYFVKSNLAPYKQFKNDFVGGLSIIDVMMFNLPEQIQSMLNNFELV